MSYKLQPGARLGPSKLDSQRGTGFWLDKDAFSNEAIVSTCDGQVTKARASDDIHRRNTTSYRCWRHFVLRRGNWATT